MLQLDLIDFGIKPIVKNTFSNYIVSEDNIPIIAHVKYLVKHPESSYIYLWGKSGVGKSHLLQAVCEEALSNNLIANYFSFKYLQKNNILDDTSSIDSLFENLEQQDIICLDDLDVFFAGNSREREEQLFGFYNRLKDANKILIIAGMVSINSLNILLPDLKSRLSSGAIYQLKELDDQGKKQLLKIQAFERGMTLSEELAEYLINHGRRDINGLLEMLDTMDRESMRQKRKLTIPFAKEILFV